MSNILHKIFTRLTVSFVFLCTFLYFSDSQSQGRDRSKFRVTGDTTNISIDTTSGIDTLLTREPLDSTARLKYFTYERKEQFTARFGNYQHPLLLYRSSSVDYRVTFDSLDNVELSESFEGEQIKVPVKIPFEEYIEKRSQLAGRQQFYNIVAEFYKISTEDELEKLFKNITDISIPLPFSSETIFGPPTINLKINGLIDIIGSYQRTTSNQPNPLLEPSQDNINFKQEVQVSTKGSVGDKLTIDADWNSQRTFEYENQLKLKYKGYTDEVVQSIEAGNVSLETRSNLIGSTQALFGVKGQFKLGPLSLTGIASQKKSEKKEVNVTGGTQEIPFDISIWDYSENNYFLDTAYRDLFESYYRNGSASDTMSISGNEIEVWVQTTPTNPKRRFAVCHVQLDPRIGGAYDSTYYIATDIPGRRMSGYFYQLDPSEFTLHREAGYISVNVSSSSPNEDAIAVAYKRNHSTVQYGDFANNAPRSTLILKIARYKHLLPPNQDTSHATAWELKLKNIYSLGVRNIRNDRSSLKLDIYRKPPGVEPQKTCIAPGPANGKSWVTLTGLDKYTNSKPGTPPDGEFDFIPGITINLTAGEIIFPTLRPFSATLRSASVPDSLIEGNDSVYTVSKNDPQLTSLKFSLVGKAIGEASSRYNLGFNVVEPSVKVYNGSVELTEGVDYTIDYTSGELIIRNAAALVAGQNLKITYETNDLFQLASKTLLGTRAELTLNKTSYIGFTMLNLKQQTLNDKVRIGEEPTNNTIFGFDASTDIKANFLTKLINKIPGYSTKETSTINLKGEVAFMLPDPNTKKSRIPGDNGEAIAYIDDFEGSKKVIPLGLSPLTWTVASIPIDSAIAENDSLMSLRRCKINWYNHELIKVLIKDVYPDRNVASGQPKTLTPFIFNIRPKDAGMFNYVTQTTFETFTPVTKNWCGIFKFLNTTSTNLVDENINYIEIWMKVDTNTVGDSAKMLIDLGTITEKIITSKLFPPRIEIDSTLSYHTEDLNRNGVLDVGEDIGLDGYASREQTGLTDGLKERDIGTPYGLGSDPSRDDYNWTQNSLDMSGFNGTEGNSAVSGGRIDTEDLNGNGTLDELNSFFEYSIPLDTHSLRNHPYIVGGGNNGWHQFIVPLDEFAKKVGTASFTNVQYARIWFKGFSADSSKIMIVDMSLVGNQWIKSNKNDTTYSVGVVNLWENSNIYMPPVAGDVLRQKDQTQADPDALLNEQSLSLEGRNLLPGRGKFAFKSFSIRPLDLINYKIIKMFVNGDSSFHYTDSLSYDAAVVLRLGSDTANYYEYRAPIHPDQRPATPWNAFNEVSINISDLTAIKQVRDSATIMNYVPVSKGPPGAKYGIIGNPSIRSITQIVIGFVNNHNDPIYHQPISGSVWFNELRVLKTNDKGGYAYNINAAVKIADFANLNFAYSKVDPNFHSLEGRFGTLNLANSWELSGTINAHKVINALLASYVSLKLKDFLTLPITFSHSEVYDRPEYVPSTDIRLETAIQNILDRTGNEFLADQMRISSQTLTVSNRFSVNGMKFTYPGENFLVQQILNKLELSFYRNSLSQRSPSSEARTAWEMGGNLGINSDMKLMDKLNLNIGKLVNLGDEFKNAKLYFFFPFMPLAPLFSRNLNAGFNFTRNHGEEKLRQQLTFSPTTRNFNAGRNFTLDWKFIENWFVDVGGTYTFNAGSDLTYLETTSDSAKAQRSGGEIIKDIFFNNAVVNFGKDQSYTQAVSINPKINIPGLRNFLDLTTSYHVQYGWNVNLLSPELGNQAKYNSDIQSTAFLKLNEVFKLFSGRHREKYIGSASDTVKQSIGDMVKFLGTFVPSQITLTYSQTKDLTNPGVAGRPGFANFWVYFNSREDRGPSRLYQLGWATDPGPRMPNLQIFDNFINSNNLNISTFINPIFPDNLKITLSYKRGWSSSKNLNYNSNERGELGVPTSTQEDKTITRPTFFFSSDIIPKLAKPEPSDTGKAGLIAKSFEENVISIPFPTWNLTLTGVEKFELFKGFANSMSIESGYNSEYKKILKTSSGLNEYISSQSLTSGFNPILGVNISFKPIEEGNLTASFKLSKTNNFDVDLFNSAVNHTSSADVSINASYSKTGFKIPLFGLSLSNDLTIAFSYTRTTNDPTQIKYSNFGVWETSSLTGSISTTWNPSIQYALSKSVTVQLFYKYNKTAPNEGSSVVIERTSNEAGLNIKLSIQ